ncbi:MAG: T9SS type A sorting domain-containing protein [Salegentibacter sp.]
MRHFYLLGFFFLPVLSFSQLSISPSPVGASYVFVKDEVLFVQQDVHLEKNNSSQLEASLYLRGDAQLIQGEKVSNLNSGNGLLSLFQEGTSNAYDYNYWSLPVADNLSNNNQFGSVFFEPLDVTKSIPAKMISGLDGTANPLSISRKWLYKFSGKQYNDWQYIGDSFDVLPGEGFTMKGVNGINSIAIFGILNNPGSQQRYDFRGKPNDGEIRLKINKDQAVLTGNPYPSALDLKQFLLENPASTGIAYFWDSRPGGSSHYLQDYEGGYGLYSPGANAYVPAVFEAYDGNGEAADLTGGYGQLYGREFAPVAQGFMLIGQQDGTIVFKNSYRRFQKENPENSEFKKPLSGETTTNEIPNLRLNISFNRLYTRQLLLAFNERATSGVDRAMDAQSFSDLDSDAGWKFEDGNYIVDVRPFNSEDKIPLSVQLKEDSGLVFQITSFKDFQPLDIFLFDAEDNAYYNIAGESKSFQLPKGNYPQRFFLCFRDFSVVPNALASAKEIKPIKNSVDIFQNNERSQLEVRLPEETDLKELKLHNLNGAVVFSSKINEKERHLEFPTSGLQNAVYIVELFTSDNKKLVKKVNIKN